MYATNLAVELAALAEGTVTLVDLDYRFGQVATFLDVEPTYTLADLCGSPKSVIVFSLTTRALLKSSFTDVAAPINTPAIISLIIQHP